ncbi:MAG: DUF2914 domain-containing protein [Candidatus Thorarchaeota archaeon]
MRTLLLTLTLLFAMPAFSQGILTEAYKSELQQNIEEIEALKEGGLATEREIFMLGYYKKKLGNLNAEASGSPHRAIFTTSIQNREPVDNLASVTTSAREISFFTELRNLNGKTATHRWSVSGEVIYSKDFRVGADRWRVWSTKTITPFAGKVVVVQILVNGQVITQETIRVN